MSYLRVLRPSLYLAIACAAFGLFVFSASAVNASQWIPRAISGADFTDMAFSDANNGVAVSVSGEVYQTSNGNHSDWVLADVLNPGLATVAYAPNTSFVYIGSTDSAVYKSGDRGLSWAPVASASANRVTSMYFTSETDGWLVDDMGFLYKTTDGAASWQASVSPGGFLLYDVYFSDPLTGWASGSAGIVMNTIDGNSWNMAIAPIGDDLLSVVGDGISVYATGTNNAFVKSSDGGFNWAVVNTFPGTFVGGGTIHGLNLDPNGNLWVSGDSDDVAYSVDRGDTWIDATFSTNQVSYTGIVPHSLSMINIVGNDGVLYVYDGGAPNPPTNVSIAPDGASTTNKQPTVSWTAATDPETAIDYYNVILNGEVPENVGSNLSYSYLNDLPLGGHSVVVQAVDLGGSSANSSTYNFTITAADTTPPVVSTITPTSAVVNTPTSMMVTATDAGNVNLCNLEVDDGTGGFMSYDAGLSKWKINHTFPLSKTYLVNATCIDDAGNITVGPVASIVVGTGVAPDTTAPVVSAVSPTSVTKGVSTSIKVSATDANPVSSCNLIVDNVDLGAMAYDQSILKWVRPTTFTLSKTYQVRASCKDASGNTGLGALTTVSSSTNVVVDTSSPVVSNVQPSSVSLGSTQTITATVSDNVGVTSCYLYAGGLAKGQMTKNGSTVSKSFTFSAMNSDYSVVMQVQCNDGAGNVGVGARTVNVVKSSGVGGTVPSATYSTITASPSSVQANNAEQIVLTVNVRNDLNQVLSGKTVQLITTRSTDDVITIVSSKTNTNGQATFYIKSKKGGLSGIYAVVDSMTIADKAIYFSGIGEVTAPGSLIKLACPDGAEVNHPCKAVYFHGGDGKRHAFPNSKVYFSWYSDFNGVQEVTPTTLSSLTLGKTITYRPGVKMVKFQTVNTVYAVSKGGILRAIPDEATAKAMYGSNWNQQIDDISDAFFSHYTFGTAISVFNTYNKVLQKANVITLLQNGV